jgi:hypothetical protein
MFKTYTIAAGAGFDFSLSLRINTSILTAEIAAKINDSYDNGELVLKVSNGDVYKAVARQAAFEVFYSLLGGYDPEASIQLLNQRFEWNIENLFLGIEIIDYEILEFSATSFDCVEQ